MCVLRCWLFNWLLFHVDRTSRLRTQTWVRTPTSSTASSSRGTTSTDSRYCSDHDHISTLYSRTVELCQSFLTSLSQQDQLPSLPVTPRTGFDKLRSCAPFIPQTTKTTRFQNSFIIYALNVGVGDGGREHVPPKFRKIFFGQLLHKLWAFSGQISGKIRGNFVIFYT